MSSSIVFDAKSTLHPLIDASIAGAAGMETETIGFFYNRDVARPEQADRELEPPRRLRAWLDIGEDDE